MTTFSLNQSFLSCSGVSGCGKRQSFLNLDARRAGLALKVVSVSTTGRVVTEELNAVVESKKLKEMGEDAAAASTSEAIENEGEVLTVGGGVRDVYGEDCANEDQLVTPWSITVASGYSLLRDPHHNKGLAFSDNQRDAHYLRGLLPPAVVTQELQVKKTLNNLRQYKVPLQRYMAMMDLQVTFLTQY